MNLRRASLLIGSVLVVSACGGGVTGPPAPTPTATPTPPSGGLGTVTGSAVIAASRAAAAAAVPARPLRSSINRRVYVPDQLMVKFRSGTATAAASGVHRQAGASVLRTIARLDVQVVRLAFGVSAASAMAAYRASGLVEYAEQDAYAYASVTPNDPSFGAQWHYPQISLPAAWDLTTGGAVIVAVIDTGTRADHPDSGVHVTGFDFISRTDNGDGDSRDPDPTDPGCPNIDPSDPSHGTHVAGTVAARTNNALGVAGVNWGGAAGTRIMALRVLGQILPSTDPLDCGVGTFSDIAEALTYAADHGAKVANMSFGGPSSNATMDSAITYVRGLGVTLVAAAGNNSCGPVEYPARNANVIAVGATTITNTRAPYSACGPEIDVVAPGGSSAGGVLSTTWRASMPGSYVYEPFQGTSMATPHVAGLVALLISRGITGPANIQSVLQSTATPLGPPGFDNEFGWGLVNAAVAVGGGSGATRMCAFSGEIVATTITRQSDVVRVAASGSFTFANAQSGVKSVFVWQDIDGNSSVNAGDAFGRVDNVSIFPVMTTPPIGVTVLTYGTGAPVLSVPGGISCP